MRRTFAWLGVAAIAVGAVVRHRARSRATSKPDGDTRVLDGATTLGNEPERDLVGTPTDESSPGHAPTDLGGDSHPDGGERADDHFRPDPHAEVSPEDKESLRPVTIAVDAL